MVLGEPAVSPTASDMVTGVIGKIQGRGQKQRSTVQQAASIKQRTNNVCAVGPRGRSPKSLPTTAARRSSQHQ